jgi:hypothetical protein
VVSVATKLGDDPLSVTMSGLLKELEKVAAKSGPSLAMIEDVVALIKKHS